MQILVSLGALSTRYLMLLLELHFMTESLSLRLVLIPHPLSSQFSDFLSLFFDIGNDLA